MEENLNNQPAPSSAPKVSHTKWLIPVGVVLVFVVAAAVWNFTVYNKNLSNQPTPPPVESVKPEESIIVIEPLEVPSSWKTYTNPDFGFQFKYPEAWRKGEYRLLHDDDPDLGVIYVAVDPKEVGIQKDFESLDKAMGLVSFYISDVPFAYTVENTKGQLVKIGTEGILAYKSVLGHDDSNPFWQGMSSVNYEIDLPERFKLGIYESLSISTYYEGEKQDLEEEKIFNTIVSSFKFISTDAAATTDTRILLTDENANIYNKGDGWGCQEFNFDPANETVVYTSSLYGLSVNIPFNKKWGNNVYRIAPFEEVTGQAGVFILHGPISGFEGCGWVRTESISILPAKSADVRMKEIEKEFKDDFLTGPEIIKINGLTVIKYNYGGLCSYIALEVIGKKHNYSLSHLCGDEFESLESIVKTIKLIE